MKEENNMKVSHNPVNVQHLAPDAASSHTVRKKTQTLHTEGSCCIHKNNYSVEAGRQLTAGQSNYQVHHRPTTCMQHTADH